MKWFERNSIWIAFGFMALCILFQMWYILEIKSELKLFQQSEHIVIQKVKIGERIYEGDTIRIKHK